MLSVYLLLLECTVGLSLVFLIVRNILNKNKRNHNYADSYHYYLGYITNIWKKVIFLLKYLVYYTTYTISLIDPTNLAYLCQLSFSL